MKNRKDLEDTDVNSEDELSNISNLRVGYGGNSKSNFIRSGMANSFAQLGHRNPEFTDQEGRASAKRNFVRFGRPVYTDNFLRLTRSSANNNLRRGKLSDQNFIRFGRSEQHYNNGKEKERSGETEEPGNNQNFIRLGKRLEDHKSNVDFIRLGRDVGHLQDIRTVLTGDSTRSDIKNNTKNVRSRRSVTFSEEDETPEDPSVYPLVISKSAYDDADDDNKISSTIDDFQKPFKYYSHLMYGMPNYMLGPELSVLDSLGNGAQTERGKKDGRSRNYVRLGKK
jgi:hypothetical protein